MDVENLSKEIKHLIVRIGKTTSNVYLICVQVRHDGASRNVMTAMLPGNVIKTKELKDTLTEKYDAQKIDEGMHNMFISLQIEDKKFEAYDWLKSFYPLKEKLCKNMEVCQ